VDWTRPGSPRVTRVLLPYRDCGLQSGAPTSKVDSIPISAWPSSPVWVLMYWRGTLSTSHVHTASLSGQCGAVLAGPPSPCQWPESAFKILNFLNVTRTHKSSPAALSRLVTRLYHDRASVLYNTMARCISAWCYTWLTGSTAQGSLRVQRCFIIVGAAEVPIQSPTEVSYRQLAG
jgi:hypothetical protein